MDGRAAELIDLARDQSQRSDRQRWSASRWRMLQFSQAPVRVSRVWRRGRPVNRFDSGAEMVGSKDHYNVPHKPPAGEGPLVDPRRGDVEDDASSTIQRSLLSIAGSLMAEISLPKLLFAWTLSIVLPAIALGLAPLLATAWLAKASGSIADLGGPGAVLVLLLVAAVGWYGWRPLFRTAEANFWSLNALAVQPGYALCREALRHLAERSSVPFNTVQAGAAARGEFGGGRRYRVRRRSFGRLPGLASHPLDGHGYRRPCPEKPHSPDARQCHRGRLGLPGNRRARVGLR